VYFEKGNIVASAKEITLDADFEVKLGTELNIMQINKGVY
jgi:hypothetical protein